MNLNLSQNVMGNSELLIIEIDVVCTIRGNREAEERLTQPRKALADCFK